MSDLSRFPSPNAGQPNTRTASSFTLWQHPMASRCPSLWRNFGLAYEAHLVSFGTNDQMTPEFLSLNPNNKIPAIIDPNGPDGQPMALFESGAILIYLAEKTGKLMPGNAAGRYETMQWLMFQMGGIGPMFGQLGFFHKFAGKDFEDRRPRDRYLNETIRLLGVLDKRLEGRDWVMGDEYSLPTSPFSRGCAHWSAFMRPGDMVGFANFKNVARVLDAFLARPAVVKGVAVPG